MGRGLTAAVVSLSWILACQLPPSSQVLYRCAPDDTCGGDTQCWPDGYCHPPEDGEPPRDAGADDSGVDSGLDGGAKDGGASDGGDKEDAGIDAGEDDAGVDAGEEDAGQDAGPCVPATICPSTTLCGAFDAGCGVTIECETQCAAPEECGTQRPNECALPKLCNHGFCWENPLPQGNTLFGAFAFNPKAVFLVGEAGTVLFWNGERTTLIDVGTTADLRAVYGTISGEVFVGGERGTIIRFDGTSWQQETVPGAYRINVIWVAQNGTAFAGATGGYILKRDVSGAWAEMILNPTNTADIVGLAGLDTGVVYATTFGRVYRLPTLSANTWLGDTTWGTPARDTLLMAAVGGQLFAGGKITGQNYGQLLERQPDAGWRQYGPNVPGGIAGLTATVEGPFVGTLAGVVTKIERDGGLSSASSGRDGGVFALAPIALDTVFVAGEFGTMSIVGDAGVRQLSYGGVQSVNGLCGYADSRMYGAGNGRLVYERRASPSGVRWDAVSRSAPGVTRWLSCFADGPDRAWVMSDERYFLRQVGGVFQQADITQNVNWNGVWGSATGPIYFVNSSAQVWSHPTGDTPTFLTSAASAINAIYGVTDDDMFYVTQGGQVRTHTGIVWFDLTPPELGRPLRAVHAQRFADGGVLYSVVGTGTTWRRINGTFVADAIDAGHVLRGTWVTPQGDIWAAGDDGGTTTQGRGVLWHFEPDAGPWTIQDAPATRPFNTMTGYGETGPFLGGAGGAILRKIGADGG